MYESALESAHRLRLFGLQSALERRCEEALAVGMHPSELLRLLLEDEQLKRKDSLAKRLTTRAKFRSQCDLHNWDKSFDRGISKQKLKELALLNFYYKKQNLIIVGPTGVGKTHLAIALGRLICQEGAAVQFYSVNLLFEQIQAEKLAGRYLGFVKKLTRVPALILDDFALRTNSHEEATSLLEILEERYGVGINILTSQVDPKGWKSLFEDQVVAEAIVDRLQNPSDTVQLKGESYRKKLNPN
jgi:DNA replication protein DnaC